MAAVTSTAAYGAMVKAGGYPTRCSVTDGAVVTGRDMLRMLASCSLSVVAAVAALITNIIVVESTRCP